MSLESVFVNELMEGLEAMDVGGSKRALFHYHGDRIAEGKKGFSPDT